MSSIRIFSRVTLAAMVSLNPAFSKAAQSRLDEDMKNEIESSARSHLSKDIGQMRTVGQLLNHFEAQLPPETVLFLRQKIAGAEATPIQISGRPDAGFMIEIEKRIFTFKINGIEKRRLQLVVNKKAFSHDFDAGLEDLWHRLSLAVGPAPISLWSHLLPAAHALPLAAAAAAGMIAILGVGASLAAAFVSNTTCEIYSRLIMSCGPEASNSMILTDMRRGKDWTGPILSCGDKKSQFHQCIQRESARRPSLAVPEDLQKFYGLGPASGKSSNSFPTEPKTRATP